MQTENETALIQLRSLSVSTAEARLVAALPRWFPDFTSALSLVFLLLTFLAAVAPQFLAPGDPLAINPAAGFSPPSLQHPFGTDDSGRDVFTRVVHGSGTSLGIGVLSTVVAAGLGAVLGCAAAAPRNRFVDALFARLFEVLFALPVLVVALLFVALTGGGIWPACAAVALAAVPGYARMVRANVRQVLASDYVQQARLDGANGVQLWLWHVLPNGLLPLVPAMTLGVGQAITWVCALGFLGFGAPPPAPEWGAMLNAGRLYLSSWWMLFFPGLAIVLVALALSSVSRWLQGLLAAVAAGPHTILRDVSLSVSAGEVVGIVGESGAGKSTLASALVGLMQENPAFDFSCAGLQVCGVSPASSREWQKLRGKQLAYILQDSLGSLDLARKVSAEMREILRCAGADSSREHMCLLLQEYGFSDPARVLQRRCRTLSGGERARVQLACALAGAARVVIADEPTASLDSGSATVVLAALRERAAAGAAVVIITHDAQAASSCDRVFELRDGELFPVSAWQGADVAGADAGTAAAVPAARAGKPAAANDIAGALQQHPAAVESTAVESAAAVSTPPTASAVTAVTAALRPGRAIGLLGVSGAGKSTVLRTLAGLPSLLPPAPLGARVRFVSQDPLGSFDPRFSAERVLSTTLRANFPGLTRQEVGQQLTAICSELGLQAAILRLKTAQLSGGQRQRLALARALLAQPDVLLCDEAVSALDADSRGLVLSAVQRRLAAGMSVAWVSHELSSVRGLCPESILLADGAMIFQGSTEKALDILRQTV